MLTKPQETQSTLRCEDETPKRAIRQTSVRDLRGLSVGRAPVPDRPPALHQPRVRRPRGRPVALSFNYLGQCLSSLNGYYEHFGGDPEKPLAWGVSTYEKVYNWTWMNNGYHAEHHYRPKVHWTKMPELHRTIASEQEQAGTRVIRPPHPLGFLDADLAQH